VYYWQWCWAVFWDFKEDKLKNPGLRDLILICAGAALFTVVSVYGFGITDQARVAAGIVTGIGFLGAGVILRRDDSNVVKGLTTAATIWITAGIGMAAGSGMYILAVAVTVMVFLVLILPWRFNKKD